MRMIDADKLKTELDAWARIIRKPNCYSRGDALHIIDTAPEVKAVPVVRCRECKSHGTLKSGELFCGKIKTGIYGYYHTVKADDYCSYGERKEDRK
jgi:hypothetical protein